MGKVELVRPSVDGVRFVNRGHNSEREKPAVD